MFADLQNKYIDLYFFFVVFQLNFYFAQYGLLQSIVCTMIDVQTNSIKADFGRKPNANTLARYKLETDANDYSGNSRNGTASNVSYQTKDGIKSAYFNGSNSKIELQGFGTLNSLTVSLWTNSNASGNVSNTPFSTGPSTDNANFQIYNTPTSINASRWNGSNSDYLSSNYDCTDGTWHNIIITNGSDGLKIYVDGSLRASSNNVRIVKSDNGWTIIGNWRNGTGVAYLGYISNLIVENKVRTAQEGLDYYNKTKKKYGR